MNASFIPASSTILQGLGDLSRIRNKATYFARLALPLGSSKETIDVKNAAVMDDEFAANGKPLTDGVGWISCELMEEVAKILNLSSSPTAM